MKTNNSIKRNILSHVFQAPQRLVALTVILFLYEKNQKCVKDYINKNMDFVKIDVNADKHLTKRVQYEYFIIIDLLFIFVLYTHKNKCK